MPVRTFIRSATLIVACTVCVAPSTALAQSGGGAAVSATTPAATTPPASSTGTDASSTAADPIVVEAVALTKTQTKSVQRRVHVPADGSLGSKTRTAIKKYQRVKALTLTGRPNIETLRAMKLKIADKLEAKLRAQSSTDPTKSSTTADASTALPAPTAAAANALEAARDQIGTPYVSAGTKPGGFDCSGLTQWSFAQAGIKIPRTSFDQYKIGTAVAKADIQPGDLVFFNSNGAGASHVGIAASATTVISATTQGVMEHTIASGYWASHYVGARRVTASA
jgi:cell wall-associated NlpC family hydrolase